MALIPGTLPSNTNFPGKPQDLLNLFSSYLSAPPTKKTLFVQPTSTGVPIDGSALWFNSNTAVISIYSGGAWTPSSVAAGSLSSSSLGANSVASGNIQDGAVITSKIASYAITPTLLSSNTGGVTRVSWDTSGNFTITGTLTVGNLAASGFTNNSVPAAALGTDVGAAPWRTVTSASSAGLKTAATGDRILADTSTAAWTLSLPLSPVTGAMITVVDSSSTWSTNNLTIATPSGATGGAATIEGASDVLVCDQSHRLLTLIYTGSTWRVLN